VVYLLAVLILERVLQRGMFDPQAAGVGGHVITYSYTDPANGMFKHSNQQYFGKQCTSKAGRLRIIIMYLKADPIPHVYTYQWLDGAGNAIAGATDTVYIPQLQATILYRLPF
jgi:hypothetical protein